MENTKRYAAFTAHDNNKRGKLGAKAAMAKAAAPAPKAASKAAPAPKTAPAKAKIAVESDPVAETVIATEPVTEAVKETAVEATV